MAAHIVTACFIYLTLWLLRQCFHSGICCTTQYNTYLALVIPTASCFDSVFILIFLYRILTALAVFDRVLYFCSLWAQITRLLRLFWMSVWAAQYCSDITFVLTVAHYIYNWSWVNIFTTWTALFIVIVNFGLSHNLLLNALNCLIIKHQVGDSIIVWSR